MPKPGFIYDLPSGKFWEESQLFSTRTDRVLVAVSGGLDSMVLLHLLHEAGCQLGVAHCNFTLRQESDEEESFVQKTCEDLGIPIFTERFQTQTYADQNSLSIQMAARDLRYTFFKKIMEREGFDLCATAHHKDDNAESVLLSLLKDQESALIRSIPAKRGPYIRPLLHLSKAELKAFAQTRGIEWREDASNTHTDYLRNRIRLQVIPLLKEINPSVEEKLSEVAERYARQHQILQRQFEQRESLILKKGRRYRLPLEDLSRGEGDGFFEEFMWWWLKKEFSLPHTLIREVLYICRGESGHRVVWTQGSFWKDREDLIFEPHREAGAMVSLSRDEVLEGTRVFWEGKRVGVEVLPYVAFPGKASPEGEEHWLDFDKIQFPIKIRPWQAGDRMQPLGMRGQKKVSDIFVDLKVSVPEKKRSPVFEDFQQIICLSGFRIAEGLKLDPNTRHCLKISIWEDE